MLVEYKFTMDEGCAPRTRLSHSVVAFRTRACVCGCLVRNLVNFCEVRLKSNTLKLCNTI